jgi:hypothetical protein
MVAMPIIIPVRDLRGRKLPDLEEAGRVGCAAAAG